MVFVIISKFYVIYEYLIKEFYKKEMGLKNVYMQAKLLRPSASENILDYLDKMT